MSYPQLSFITFFSKYWISWSKKGKFDGVLWKFEQQSVWIFLKFLSFLILGLKILTYSLCFNLEFIIQIIPKIGRITIFSISNRQNKKTTLFFSNLNFLGFLFDYVKLFLRRIPQNFLYPRFSLGRAGQGRAGQVRAGQGRAAKADLKLDFWLSSTTGPLTTMW